MRILIINNGGYVVGGAERYIIDVSQLLQSKGHTTHLAHFVEDAEHKIIQNSTFVGPDKPANGNPLGKLERLIAEFRPDLAYLHVLYNPKIINLIKKAVPTAAYVHAPYIVCPGYAYYLRRSKTTCHFRAGPICIIKGQTENCCFGRNPIRHAMRLREVKSFIDAYQGLPLIVGSRYMHQLLERNGFSRDRIGIISPAVYLSSIPAYKPPRNPNLLLYQGRLIPEKGLGLLLRVLAVIKMPWKLLVAGDGEQMAAYQSLVNSLGLAEQVEFLGWVDETKLDSLYTDSSFVILPSLWPEPYGRSGAESYFRSRPVIAFDTGGVSEWLDDGITGFLVPPEDTETLRQRIIELLESPQLQRALGQTAASKAAYLWNPDDHYEQLMDIFQMAIIGGNGKEDV